MSYTMPGPGDPATWPAFAGHPNDPRHPGDAECPDCGGPADAEGCADDDCGYRWPEPDYEAMAEDRGW